VIPLSVSGLGESSFSNCSRFTSVTFQSECKFDRIESFTSYNSDLISIIMAASVSVFCKSSCWDCFTFMSVSFESETKSEYACSFHGLRSIVISFSTYVLYKLTYWHFSRLESHTLESGWKLGQFEEFPFSSNGFTNDAVTPQQIVPVRVRRLSRQFSVVRTKTLHHLCVICGPPNACD
jgi:hypothetical protein